MKDIDAYMKEKFPNINWPPMTKKRHERNMLAAQFVIKIMREYDEKHARDLPDGSTPQTETHPGK